jgi:hypothetical protein
MPESLGTSLNPVAVECRLLASPLPPSEHFLPEDGGIAQHVPDVPFALAGSA